MKNINDIPDKIWEAINYVMQYANQTENWLAVKKEILWLLTNEYRNYFSRRHYVTKKHILNDFEKLVIEYWKQETGKELKIPDNQIHNSDWIQKGRGWALIKINEERRKNGFWKKQKSE
jgi:hypothetical protein